MTRWQHKHTRRRRYPVGAPFLLLELRSSPWCNTVAVAAVILILTVLISPVDCKKTKGSFKLSGRDTEHVLQSFALQQDGGKISVQLASETVYENEYNLKLRVYRDTEWPTFQRTQLCTDKIRLAKDTYDLFFTFNGDGTATEGGKWKATKTFQIDDEQSRDRIHYWYFVVDDCSLEMYDQDGAVPKISYEVNSWNHFKSIHDAGNHWTSQLSADEHNLQELHFLVLLVSGGLAILLMLSMVYRFSTRKNNNSVHAAQLWITLSASLDAVSSLFELIHLEVYQFNGTGVYSFDAASAHLEAICDATIILFLLSIAAGWTLPSDVVTVDGASNIMQSAMREMANPLRGLMQANYAGILCISILATQVILAQWGRIYNDDFDSYHDLDHLAGKILMGIRVGLGLLFLGTTFRTQSACRVVPLQHFYIFVGILGFSWFLMLPILTWYCNWFVVVHQRKAVILLASAFLQVASILFLAWLVTFHTSVYHRYSHMSQSGPAGLTELVAAPEASQNQPRKDVKLIGRAKVRLD